jgi:pimeloyl-ACP methyl ester carboxylesterase
VTAPAPVSQAPLPALLIHGIWNAKIWLLPFAWRLRAQGLAPQLFGYTSVFGTPEVAAERLIAQLRRRPVASLIGHSLGGLVALEALRRAPDLPVRRLVCIGSPLCGSAAARNLAASPGLRLALGRSSALLQQGCLPWHGATEVGVVAGDVHRGGRRNAPARPARPLRGAGQPQRLGAFRRRRAANGPFPTPRPLRCRLNGGRCAPGDESKMPGLSFVRHPDSQNG